MAQSSQAEVEETQRQTKAPQTTVTMRRRKTTFTRLYSVTRSNPLLFPDLAWGGMRKKIGNAMTTMCSQTIMRKMAVYGKREAARTLDELSAIAAAHRAPGPRQAQ